VIEKKYNTKFSYQPFSKGSDALTALLGGSVQICNCAFTTALKGAIAGKAVNYFGNIFNGAGNVIVGAKKYEASRCTDISKYSGATFGYTSEGSTSQAFLKKAAEHAGLDWAKEKG
jgi:NitT/TauT family transport system substrate-binding protein